MAENMPLSNFGISTPTRMMIYVSGLLLIMSFFFSVKDFNVSKLRFTTGLIFAFGLLFWKIKTSIEDSYMHAERPDRNSDKNLAIAINIVDYLYIIIATLVVLFEFVL